MVYGHARSDILGTLTGGGSIYIVNPNGILIGDGAQVNVGNLWANGGEIHIGSTGGTASGDQGILGSLEFRYHTPVKRLLLSTYLDAGQVREVKSATNSSTLKGWGIGMTYAQPGGWQYFSFAIGRLAKSCGKASSAAGALRALPC